HMGIHILRAFYGVLEDNLKELVGIQQPCGFCGQSEQDKCKVSIRIKTNGAITLETQCSYQHKFHYVNVDTGSKNRPCRNIPLKCEIC
ncbi:uncharacterized protein BJ212DRAFT_1205509, partial [Suillus subaureus]